MLTDLVGARLVVVGDSARARTRDDTAEELLSDPNGRVRRVGEIEDELLRGYIRHAEALVMPSFYEGFGFPPLEAMAGGTPTIVARAGSLPEVCGDAALYFEPSNPAELAQRMREVWSSPDLRRSLAGKGRAQARRYSWDAAASALRDALARAAWQTHKEPVPC
jgi:glycosyltransferase involved in cell wall biosynthesis